MNLLFVIYGLVLALAIIGIFLSLVYIYHFFRIQKLHKSPGDIYLGMSIAELIYMLHCVSVSIVVFEGYGNGTTFSLSHKTLCFINLALFTLAVLLIFSYTIQLYLHMIIRLIYTMKAKQIQKWQGHLLTWIVSSLYALVSIASNNTEFCGLSITKTAPFTFIILLISFFAMAITARVYVRDQIAQSSDVLDKLFQEKIKMQGQGFLSYIRRLFLSQAINMTLFILFTMIAFILGELAVKKQEANYNKGAIIIFSYLAQISATVYPVLIPIIRYTDPFVWKIFQKYYATKSRENTSDISLIEQQTYSSQQFENQQPKISFDNNSLNLIEQNFRSFQGNESQELKKFHSMSTDKGRANTMKSIKKDLKAKQEDPFIHQLTSQLRSEIIKRIIAFILLKEKDEQIHIKQTQHFKKTIRKFNDDFQEQAIFSVNQIVLNQSFPNYFKQQNKQFKMIAYSPVIFNILVKEDIEQLDISNCLDLDFNAEQINQCAQTTGGKSGEFFFFNYNNRVLLKTVTVPELKILLDKLENYFWHCTNNPNTIIAKILGIYTFEGFETGRLTLILMKNIGKVNREAFLRMYDIKGSRYDREVLKSGDENQQVELSNQVLKDLDFIKIEKQMNISQQQKLSILQQLQIDTMFLKQQGFMDYSLCVIVVDWLGFYKSELIDIQDDDFLIKLVHQKVQKLQHCYQNISQPGVYYHLGIIDYLQTYNIQKMTEKYAKKLLKMDRKLDTSSQNPLEYRNRFLVFMQGIF